MEEKIVHIISTNGDITQLVDLLNNFNKRYIELYYKIENSTIIIYTLIHGKTKIRID